MPELRKDPVLNRWVIISADRGLRPNEFHTEAPALPPADPAGDPFAYGNEQYTPGEIYALRPDGSKPNTPGWQVRVVPNKYPALRIEGDLDPRGHGLYDRLNGVGAHEVVIESPEPDLALTDMPVGQIVNVLAAFRLRVEDLYRDMRFAQVLVFKNHGQAAGASLRHSHSQIIATPIVPKRLHEELSSAQEHWRRKRRSIFVDIIDQELLTNERLVWQNEQMVAFCPFASASPFEVHIYPRRHSADFRKASAEELKGLAATIKACLLKWRGALGEIAYNFLIHTAPNDRALDGTRELFPDLDAFFHWHVEMFPRLANTAGFEWGTGYYINHVPPEEAAKYLGGIEVSLN